FQTVTATTGDTDVTLGFSEALACGTVAAADFTATIDGTAVAVDGVTCGAGVHLILHTGPAGGSTVEVTLSGTVTHPPGNAATGGPHSATVDNTGPVLAITTGP